MNDPCFCHWPFDHLEPGDRPEGLAREHESGAYGCPYEALNVRALSKEALMEQLVREDITTREVIFVWREMIRRETVRNG